MTVPLGRSESDASVWRDLRPPYRTIVADPPWPIGDPTKGLVVAGKGGRRRRATTNGYSLMSVEEIAALPVGEIADLDGSHLYLWVTAQFNRKGVGVRVAEAWGFSVIGEAVWEKPNFGMGAFPRPQHEILLVCRRGKLGFARRDVGSVWRMKQSYGTNHGKTHSAKPSTALALIETASPGPYVELFSRQTRLGWDSWGWGVESA